MASAAIANLVALALVPQDVIQTAASGILSIPVAKAPFAVLQTEKDARAVLDDHDAFL